MKNRSRTVTVTGEVIYNPDVYGASRKAYAEEYSYLDYYTADGTRHSAVAIRSYGIRFAEPVVVDIGGVETTISEAWYSGHPSTVGFQELTGYFQVNEDYSEITPVSRNGHETVEYNPNGPYTFIVSESKG